ncbi:hypothetical protein QUF76_16630 [Desulfobacterales bacterium HSG16]|nr:hypothetical protein [Desulfobacterales bacterium HSG16]
MIKVDQFESVFRSSVREIFVYEKIEYKTILIVSDLSGIPLAALLENIQKFMTVIGKDSSVTFETVSGPEFDTTEDLLNLAEKKQPDLIVTYRNLKTRAWRFPHSLGEHLDVLLQKTATPVLVLPHPDAGYAKEGAMEKTGVVMAVTDHMAKDQKLVNHAARFTAPDGKLFLTHIENLGVFEKYMDAISKIHTIETEDAKERIGRQLLKDPKEYIESCRAELMKNELPFSVSAIVEFGTHLSEYKKHIEDHDIDLLVMNTKDEDQLAMHGLAYPLAVELRSIPLLML